MDFTEDIPSLTSESKADSTTPDQTGPKPKYKLSCSLCRSRKIKCDRVHPCAHCVRSGNECVFPSRKRMQRPRRSKNSELLSRLSRLETIVGNVNVETLKDMDMSEFQGLSELKAQMVANDKPTPIKRPSVPEDNTPSEGRTHKAHPLNSPAPKEGTHIPRYIGGDFWANLASEVEGLKQALAQSSDSDTEDESPSASPEATAASKQTCVATQGLLAGYHSPDAPRALLHPPAYQIHFLAETFFRQVDPIIKILHRPTILKMIAEGTESLTVEREALQFAIYFSALTSLSPEQCRSHFGQEQQMLLKSFQIELERALAAADYLNSNHLECLQAFLLYVACLRIHNETRASWVLTSMLLRLAQAYNLWHDGDGSQHTPYEAQMRRRLWWQVVVLDIRASEDRGTEAMIDPDSYNTQLPLNVNDDDFGPESTVAPPERTGPSDVTFSLCTAQSSSIFLWVGHAQARFSSVTPHQSEDEIIAKAQALEERFITNHDPNHYQSMLAAGLVRLINLKLWLIMQYPLHTHPSATHRSYAPRWPKVSREAILQTAVSAMELHEHKHNVSKEADRFRWWGASYVQWHPLAVALAELCAQTRGPLVERAWKIVETVYPKWALVVADSKRGALWRPIRKLYKKAKGARTAAIEEDVVAADQSEALQRLELFSGDRFRLPVDSTGLADGQGRNSAEGQQQQPLQAQLQAQPQSQKDQRLQSPDIRTDPVSDDMMWNTNLDFSASGDPMSQNNGQMDFEISSLPSSTWFTNTWSSGWPDNINFDMPPPETTTDSMNWTVWNEFIQDTSNVDALSRTGSSDTG